ncbi:O-methyltransferase [Candidatus Nitrospira neomarina]|uniref:Class I SAM-dependent methyltransferase n=1 Tax=Candidatus Nitrospira neomarina TaxID=3020899 RepID=A0AA96GJW5_9BACT|nr:class I SAM-dependent methyltransferase [Candidatus Nitrospira neomarina]WNM61705.1 class I SAM-dependent methyltransferase [Candidatus Nitrospira neomarina]
MKSLVLPDIEAYAEAHSLPESEVCRRLREETYRNMDCPQMVVGPLEGAFLKVMALSVGAKRVLEIGTFTGYSALCMAECLPDDGVVITCDIDPESTAMAKRYWAQSAHGTKIHLRLGPALETMATLTGTFDLIFIDADKANYVNYFRQALELISDQGVILIDNVLWNGDVLTYPAPDTNTAAIQELNRVVHAEPRVSAVLLTIRDGIFLIKLRPSPNANARVAQQQAQQ